MTTRWSIYTFRRLKGAAREAVPLGYVYAPHQPAAVRQAWAKWPEHMDETMVQAGFSVREYARDRMSLGPANEQPAKFEG